MKGDPDISFRKQVMKDGCKESYMFQQVTQKS